MFSAENLFGFIVAIILLSFITQVVVTANIIIFSFSSLLSFQFSYFISLISTFSIPTLSLISPFFLFPFVVEKICNTSFFVKSIYSNYLFIKFFASFKFLGNHPNSTTKGGNFYLYSRTQPLPT